MKKLLAHAKGKDGIIEVYEDGVKLIRKKGLWNAITAFSKPDHDFEFEEVESVYLKAVGVFINGYVQFTLGGMKRSRHVSGTADAVKDDYSVVFTTSQKEKMEKVVELIRSKVRKRKAAEEQISNTVDVVTALEKLAKLRDTGALSEEEFETQKQRLLTKND